MGFRGSSTRAGGRYENDPEGLVAATLAAACRMNLQKLRYSPEYFTICVRTPPKL